MFVVPASLVDTVDENRERHSLGELVLDHATPAAAEFVLDRLTPLHNRHSVRVVVRVQQFQTGAVVETAVKVDGLDAQVEDIEVPQELCEHVAGGLASFQLADRQRVLVAHAHVEYDRRETRWFLVSPRRNTPPPSRPRHRSGDRPVEIGDDLVQLIGGDLHVLTEANWKLVPEAVDNKINQVLFLYFTVCLC